MGKFFKYLTLLLFALSVALILWMNATPGFFRFPKCGCNVGYLTNEGMDKKCQGLPEDIAVSCKVTPIGNLMLKFAQVDYYR